MEPNTISKSEAEDKCELKKEYDYMETITEALDKIPTTVTKIELRQQIEPIFIDLADLDEATQMAVLSEVKNKFGLTNDEIRAYKSYLVTLKPEKNEKQDTELTAVHPNIIDLVKDDNGDTVFLMHGKEGLEMKSSFTENDKTYLPPDGIIPFPLVSGKDVINAYSKDDDKTLFNDIVAYFRTVSDLDEKWYSILASWVMHTWFMDQFDYSPMLVFHAVAERGKTRTTKALTYLSYRGFLTVTLREAHLLRLTNDWDATTCLDVMDLWKKVVSSGTEDFALNRFQSGAQIMRVTDYDKGRYHDTTYYNIYGPTIISTNESLHHILDTRAITYTMHDSIRSFPDDVTFETAIPLKVRITAFCARNMKRQLPEADKPTTGRLGDILRPLRQIVKLVKPEWEDKFMIWVDEIKKERATVKQDTPDGLLLRAVKNNLGKRFPDDRMFVKDITDSVNQNRINNKKLTSVYVAKKLHALGFTRGTKHNTGNTIECPDDVFIRIAEKYGIDTVLPQDDAEDNEIETSLEMASNDDDLPF